MTEATRFARDVALRSAAAWIVAVCVLSGLSVALVREREQQDLDLRLRAIALAVYGMAWFDEQGVFHDEVIRKETKLLESGLDVRVIAPSGTMFASPARSTDPPGLPSVVTEVLASEAEQYTSGVRDDGTPFRLLALPTYDDKQRLAGVVVAIGDPTAGAADVRAFTLRLTIGAVGLIAVGIAGSAVLARSLHDRLHRGIRERERFLAAAAHELRTPVATLLAVADSALAGDEPPLEAMRRVKRVAGGAGELVDGLLAWARMDELVLRAEPVRLDLLVEACVAETQACELEPTTVTVDAALVKIALVNVLRNAEVHGGGVRLVRLRGGKLEVFDNGPGLPADAGLASPFVKGPNSHGAGLGLAVVTRIVALHGATLTLGPGPCVSLAFRPTPTG